MEIRASTGLLGLCTLISIPLLLAGDTPSNKASGSIAGFTLKDTNGREVSLAEFKDKKAIAVVFMGTECPVNNLYMRRLKELHEEYASKGVQFLGINSNSQDTAERIAEHAQAHQVPFPVLKDADHRVADLFQAARTPEVYVLDGKGTICYGGRIDDQYGIGFQRTKPTRGDLAEALNDILEGKPISVAKTAVAGCVIGRAKKAEAGATITYTKQVSRILQNNCQECHRPGQIGPFSLLTYDKARGWADTIREVVNDGRMPPWHADPRYGKFSNDRSLSKQDRETLLAWIDQGCPQGDDKDLPPPKEFTGTDGWVIGKPDAVLSMPSEFKVPAKAGKDGIPYQHFMVSTNFTEDRWIQAAEAKPGNRAVVHHIVVFSIAPGQQRQINVEEGGELGDFIVATAPGDLPLVLEPGVAKKLPKGATLVLQLHYTPNGVEQTDRSSVGLIFAKEPPKHIARTQLVMQQRFAIPPGDGNYKVDQTVTFKKDVVVLSIFPHMHLRGKSFEFRAVYPDNRSEVVLSVPRYDFAWQSVYRLEKPLRFPAGTRLDCTAHFDNSAENPNNPDPTQTVRWGDQTWEEMMVGFVDYHLAEETSEKGEKEKQR